MERVKRNTVIAIGLSSIAVLILTVAMSVFGWSFPHAILQTACHQDPERCLSVAGVSMALCARCTAVFAGLFIGSGLVFVSVPSRHRALRFLVFAVVLTVLDVTSETVGLYTDLVIVRLVTGWLLGSAVALMIGSQDPLVSNSSILPSATPAQT